MSISFQELAQECVSFETSGSVQSNQLCCMSANNTVKACTEGSVIHGYILGTRCGAANVAVRGFVTASYSGTAPTVGFCSLVAHNAKTVKVSEGAKEYLVVSVNTANKTVCFLM